MKTWKTWTAKETARLVQMRAEGKSAPEIAASLGRTLSSVKNRIHQVGAARPSLPCRRLTSPWYRAFQEPHTIAGLAEQFAVTKWAVKRAKNRLRRMGLRIQPARRT